MAPPLALAQDAQNLNRIERRRRQTALTTRRDRQESLLLTDLTDFTLYWDSSALKLFSAGRAALCKNSTLPRIIFGSPPGTEISSFGRPRINCYRGSSRFRRFNPVDG